MKNSALLQPAVSIALCTYNGERYLKEQLESILNQDYVNINEIVCVDDRSTDKTWDILNEYANKYSIFKIIKNDTNLGFIKNYEKSIALTTNDLIAISDQDDIWYSAKITKLVGSIGNDLMIYSDNEFIDADGKSLGIRFSDKRNLATCTSCLNFALFNGISGHTAMINRQLLQHALPFPSDIHYDWWLGFCAAQHAEIKFIDEPLVGYRQHVSNAVGGFDVKRSDKKTASFSIPNEAFVRISFFSKSIAVNLTKEKLILEFLAASYLDKSLKMRIKRVGLFLDNKDAILVFKKKSRLRKVLFCFKASWKYD